MDNLQAVWGRIFIWGEHIPDVVHPSDQRQVMEDIGISFDGEIPNSTEGKVLGDIVQCVEDEGEYITVRRSDEHRANVRLRREAFHVLPTPPFVCGESVRVLSKGHHVDAVIELICWHFKNSEYYFYVSVDGKRLKKQYWCKDFLDANEEFKAD